MFNELNSKKLDQTIAVLEKNYYALSSMLDCESGKVLTEEQVKEQMREIINLLNYLYCVK